jgi:hypothetical protein
MKRLARLALASLILCAQIVSADWEKSQSLDIYADQITPIVDADGTTTLYFLDKGKEISFMRQIEPGSDNWTQPRGLNLNGNAFAIERRADGRLEMFIIATLGNAIGHSVQTAPGSDDWSKERDLDIYASQLRTATHPDGSVLLFFLDMGREIGYLKQESPESDNYSKTMLGLNGNAFTLGEHADGRVEIVIIGTMANVLSHVTETQAGSGVFTGEQDIDGYYATQIYLVNQGDGSLTLFILDMGREVASLAYADGGFKNGKELGLNGNGMVVTDDGDRIHIYLVATMGNALTHTMQVEPNGQQWVKEQDLDSYGWYLAPVTNMDGSQTLYYIAMLASEVRKIEQK